MPSQRGLDAWDVDRLVELSRDLPVMQVDLAEITEVDSVYWFSYGWQPTVRAVVEHIRLIEQVDMAYPIILSPDGRVMDGMHRVARAMLGGAVTVAAVRLPRLPEPDFRDCQPDQLPYDG